MSPEVRPVGKRLVVYYKDNVIESHNFRHGLSDLTVDAKRGEINDLSLILSDDEVSEEYFRRSADHTEGLLTSQLRLLDQDRLAFAVPYNFCTRLADADFVSFCEVASSADDLFIFFKAHIGNADLQSIRVRMRQDLLYLAYHDVVELIGCL